MKWLLFIYKNEMQDEKVLNQNSLYIRNFCSCKC